MASKETRSVYLILHTSFCGLWSTELLEEPIPLEEVRGSWKQCSYFRATRVLVTKSLFQSFEKCLPVFRLSPNFLRLCWCSVQLTALVHGWGGCQYLGSGHTQHGGVMQCGHLWASVAREGCRTLWHSWIVSGHPKLRLALTGQHESLTSTLPSWSLGVRRGKPSPLLPIFFSRQTELRGYYGTEQRVSTGCKLLFTVFFSHFSKEAICENRTFSGSSPTKRKCSHMGIWDSAFWLSCPVLATLDPVKRLLFQGQQKQK